MAAKANMSPVKTPMPSQPPEVRAGNFLEVTYDPEICRSFRKITPQEGWL